MPTQKRFLDQNGLIQLLQEIESLDETNIKDVYWSTDNADTYPTIVFKVGDDNGSAHTIKKFTFKGDITSPAPSNTTTRSITLTIGGANKTITYYDTTGSASITYTNAADTGSPTTATNVKTALDRVINKLASITTDLNTVATDKGADMVAYSSKYSVKDALDDIYNQIGGGGGNSLTDRVDVLEGDVADLQTNKASKSEAVGSITGTTGGNETANFSMVNGTAKTFVYKNDKVAYTSDTTTNGNLPVVLGNGATPTTPGGVKYNTAVTFNPNTKTLQVQDGTSSMSIDPTTLNSVSGTGSSRKEVSIGSTGLIFLTTAGNQVGNITNNGTTVTFTGTSAKSVSDGDGNNIVNTYATKTALEALTQQLTGSFQIVTTLPTADGTHGGIIYLIKDQEYGNTNSNIFKEYIEVNDSTTSTPNWKFELLGTTDAGVDVVTIPATGTNSVHSYFAQYVINA